MPLFQTKIPIDEPQIAKILLENWQIKIDKLLKASQNHTYSGYLPTSPSSSSSTSQQPQPPQKCSIRITPDPQNIHFARIRDQIQFVRYCAQHKLKHVCAPIPTKKNEFYVKEGDVVVVVFEWAQGEPINFFQLKWMSDQKLIHAWGRYFAELHRISKQFSKECPEIANRIQNWNQIHHGVLSQIQLAEEDQKDVKNTQCFGVIHGDLNTSNSFYNREGDYFSVYDTDQTQRGFYEWDLAQAIFGVVMLKQAGMPISGNPVPEANRQFFENHLIQGYEKVLGESSINRARLGRMVDMKRQFYRLFCIRAIEQGNIPKDMEPFINFIAKSFNKSTNKQQKTEQKKQQANQQNKIVEKQEQKNQTKQK